MANKRKKGSLPLPQRVIDAWLPPDDIAVPDWVEKYVRLPDLTCPEPGPLRISRTPYTRGPLEALGSPFIDWVVLVWGRQLGKSQGVQYPFLCYCIAEDPGPALFVLPTTDLAAYTSQNRIQPMFEACEPVKEKKTKDEDEYTILEMKFTSMVLSIVGGGSGSQMMSRPVRYLFRDEIDELKKMVGQDGTNPMKAVEETTSNFSNRKIIDTSTPTVPSGNIWTQLKTCQLVFEFWVDCPSCGAPQILYWDQVRYGVDEEEKDPEIVANAAYYECESCQAKIRNADKIRMLETGQWRARLAPNACEQILKNVRAKVEESISLDDVLKDHSIRKVGFHLPKWYSPFQGGSFGQAAKERLQAQKALDEGQDFALMRDWRKYWAARPWEETALGKSEQTLMENIIDLPPMVCPRDTIALTCGIDVGQGGFWFATLAWRQRHPCWPHLIHYGFVREFEDLEELLFNSAYPVDGEHNQVSPWRAGIDTGGSRYEGADTTMTAATYLWLRKTSRPGLYGTKGMSHPTLRVMRQTKIDKMPDGKPIPGGLVLWEINTWAIKDKIQFHLTIEEERPGRFTFHSGTDKTYIEHLLAEEKRLQKDGSWDWVQVKKANHLLDCTVIAFGLADPEAAGGIMIHRPATQPSRPSGSRQEKKDWIRGEKKGGWIGR